VGEEAKNSAAGSFASLSLYLARSLVHLSRAPVSLALSNMDSAMAENMFRKAHSLWMGEGSAVVDNEGAFGLFQTAAQLGHAGAQCALGIMYLCGSGTERDDVTAVRWLKRAADQNYTRALRLLGSMWSAGRGLHADEDTRLFRECQEAADRGDPVAQHYTALLYECGRGTERSTERAVKYYEMAIERNYALSINNLGFMYYRGTGVPVDKPRGLELLQRAAALGLPIANTTLGFVHKQGDPGLVEKNLDKAIECFTLAADNGDAVAHLERMSSSLFVRSFVRERVSTISRSLDRGSGISQSRSSMRVVGQIYAELNRHQEAFARFLQSAGFGHPSAFNALGLCCFSGKGTPVDLYERLVQPYPMPMRAALQLTDRYTHAGNSHSSGS